MTRNLYLKHNLYILSHPKNNIHLTIKYLTIMKMFFILFLIFQVIHGENNSTDIPKLNSTLFSLNETSTNSSYNNSLSTEDTIKKAEGTIYFLENKNIFLRALLIIICVAFLAMLYLFVRCLR